MHELILEIEGDTQWPEGDEYYADYDLDAADGGTGGGGGGTGGYFYGNSGGGDGGGGGNAPSRELPSARGFGLLPGGIGPLSAQQQHQHHQQQQHQHQHQYQQHNQHQNQQDDEDDVVDDGNVASAAVIARPADIVAAGGASGPAVGAEVAEEDDEEPVAEIDLGDDSGGEGWQVK